MALNYVTLTVDLFDGQGDVLTAGTAAFSPSVQLTDATDHQIITEAAVTVRLSPSGPPTVKLLATDNSSVTPSGWAWTVTFSGVSGNPASFSFFLKYADGAAQNLSALSPVSSAVTQFPANPMTAAGDLIIGGTSGVPERLGIGTANEVLTVVSGAPAWGSASAASLPITTFGDMIYEDATPTPARLPGNTSATKHYLTQTGTGSASAAPVWDTIAAADVPTLNQNTTGTASNVTGTVAIANGGTGATTQQAAVNALTGTQSAGKYLRSDGTNASLASIAAADVPTLNQSTTGNAATATNLAGGATVPAYLAPHVVTLTDAATIAVDASLGNDTRVTLGGNRTMGAPSNPVDGQIITIDVQQDATGSRTLTWTSGAGGYSFGTDGAPVLTTTASAVDTVGFRYHAGLGKWICCGWKLGFS